MKLKIIKLIVESDLDLKGNLGHLDFFFYGFPKIRRVAGKKFSHINFMHIPAEKLRLLLYSKSLTTLFTTINKPFNSVTALRSRLTNLTLTLTNRKS